jgi:CheY-like chemotaxis protein
MDLAAIPVIVVSGRDLRGNKERALKLGAAAFLQKPWDDDELLSLIARLLGQPDIYGQSKSIPIWDANETLTPLADS